eukprot:4419100-Amphidinium_carterae.1
MHYIVDETCLPAPSSCDASALSIGRSFAAGSENDGPTIDAGHMERTTSLLGTCPNASAADDGASTEAEAADGASSQYSIVCIEIDHIHRTIMDCSGVTLRILFRTRS